FKRMTEVPLTGKRVFIRADLNVPIDDGRITDDTRIRASLPGIRRALEQNAAVMVTSHLGRPKEGVLKPEDSLAPVAKRLAEMLGVEVPLISNWVNGVKVEPGNVVMLENCRVNKGERKDDAALARKIAALCDVYVNDAFGAAHRAEATTHAVARFALVACAGPLMAAELDALGRALANPARPRAPMPMRSPRLERSSGTVRWVCSRRTGSRTAPAPSPRRSRTRRLIPSPAAETPSRRSRSLVLRKRFPISRRAAAHFWNLSRVNLCPQSRRWKHARMAKPLTKVAH